MGKNYPLDLALLGDPKAGLQELGPQVAETLTDEGREKAAARRARYARERSVEQDRLRAEIEAGWDAQPMEPVTMTTTSVLLDAFLKLSCENSDQYGIGNHEKVSSLSNKQGERILTEKMKNRYTSFPLRLICTIAP